MRAALAVLLLVLAGCSATASDGRSEETIVYVPSSVVKPAPLVVMLHGGFGSASQARRAYGWDAAADKHGFVVAYPNGKSRSWNAGPECCGPQEHDDTAFLHGEITRLVRDGLVDARRVYVTGMSNGAMMSYAVACAFPDDVAAIGPVAGARIADCDKAKPTPVFAIHGTADRNVPIEGGVGPAGVTKVDYRSLDESLDPFLRTAQCPSASVSSPSGKYTQNRWQCSGNVEVATIIVDGGGHEWPDGATEWLWARFSRHARDQ